VPAASLTPLRVDLLCTGLDRIRRGYESFARECFDALKGHEELDLRLYKGNGSSEAGERSLACLPREAALAGLLGRATGRSAYHVEQLTFLLSYMAGPLRREAPRLVFTSDANLANFLSRWRRRTGAGYRILYSNGGPISPPFPEYDHVQQVAKPYLDEALATGEPASKHSLVPYGIHIPGALARGEFADRIACRRQLGLPTERRILLSVGYVSATHKRMDHVVREVACVPQTERPFLVLLGQQDASTEDIRRLATELLGAQGFLIDSVGYEQVKTYYGAADCFVLASLKEGFGRVLLEASMHGLPCVVDDNPVMRYVLGDVGFFIDMSQAQILAAQLGRDTPWNTSLDQQLARLSYVVRRFGWEMLAPAYVQLFQQSVHGGRK
jgi:glycosyltransferase involved in cell wall biosynthesis